MKQGKSFWCGMVIIVGALFIFFAPRGTVAQGGWNISTIDDVGSRSSIALDSNDAVHISYYSYGDLKYATNASGSWDIATVESTGDRGCGRL